MKVSDTPSKVLNPGAKRLWRMYDADGSATADVLSTADEDLAAACATHAAGADGSGVAGAGIVLHHHTRPDVSRTIPAGRCSEVEELPVPVLANGALVYPGGQDALDDLDAARARRDADVDRLDPGVRRLVNPHVYHVSLTDDLFAAKQALLDRFAVG
jgi:nicotinate phosphoribosyltransferase